MGRNNSLVMKISHIIYIAILSVLVYSCANKGYPQGGPKDETPPVMVRELPMSYSTNFDKKRIKIYFNEYVQLKDANKNFIISPPQKKKPKIRLGGKYIKIDFEDSLKANTTYSLDFGSSIVDNNESNPLGFYRYVFSTGNHIDTMEMSGHLMDAESNKPILGMQVFLYKKKADSVPLKDMPDYVAITDSLGFFHFTNISDTTYRIFALNDLDRNYNYLPGAEEFAFLDTVIKPWVEPIIISDTIRRDSTLGIMKDSLVHKQMWAYGPADVHLRLFKEKPTNLYLKETNRKNEYYINFEFSIPGNSDLRLENEENYIRESSIEGDSVKFWIRDSIFLKDTINVIYSYNRTDTLGGIERQRDTNEFVYKRPRVNKKTKIVNHFNIKVISSNRQRPDMPVWIEFETPFKDEDISKFKVLQVIDTLYKELDYSIIRDSVKIRRLGFQREWKFDSTYVISLDSALIYNAYGKYNNKFEHKFSVPPLKEYAEMKLNISGVKSPMIIQLHKAIDEKTKAPTDGKIKYSIVAERHIAKDTSLLINYLNEGDVQIRAIFDDNSNGLWDTGIYLKNIQPEIIQYFSPIISLKKNFTMEQDIRIDRKLLGTNHKKEPK